jgi:UDP-GlcNAc3NAcA epimerase
VIKASRLSAALSRAYDVLTVDTGQHYDYELNALLYEQLGVRTPDALLDVGSGTHAVQMAAILTRVADLFVARRPSMVVVIGDTNSTLGCAIAAAQRGIPVVHVEAGLRSGSLVMAEEINRRMVDAISAVLCAPSERSAAQLRAESVPGIVVETGDIAYDVLKGHLQRIASAPPPIPGVARRYAFATLHRAELTDDRDRFAGVLAALAQLDMPVLLPLHPRTRETIERFGLADVIPSNVSVYKPFGYLETLMSIRDAAVVLTDSGGVQREAYWMGTPCITLRQETEWTETVDVGANQLLFPEDAPTMLGSIVASLSENRAWDRRAYGDGNAASAITAAIGLALHLPRVDAHLSVIA